MKNSNKVLISFIAVLLISIVLVDVSLKNAYLKIDLEDAFKNYEPVDIKPFNHLKLQGGNGFAIEIIQADSVGMRVMSSRKSFLNMAYHQDTLIIDFAVADNIYNQNPEILPKGIMLYVPIVKTIHSDGTSNILSNWNTAEFKLIQTSQSSTFINNFTAQRFTLEGHHNSICNFRTGIDVRDLNLRLKNSASVYLERISYSNLNPQLEDGARLIFNAQSVAELNK